MNNKGYTLVELLAVIVILAVIAGIGIISVNKYIDASRERTLKLQYESIESTAESFCKKKLLDEIIPSEICKSKSDNCCTKVPEENEICYIVLDDLITEGLTEQVKDPKNGGYISVETLIEVTYRNNQFVAQVINK